MDMKIIISVILLFVGVGVLVLIHVCIVGRAFRRGFGNTAMVGRSSTGGTSMSQDDLENLPSFDFIAKDKGSSPVDCAVCLENFKMGEKCRLLPTCKHSFHAQCVDAWLLKIPICPICRASADSRKAKSVLGEQSSHFIEGNELRGSQTTESSHFSDLNIEVREIHTIQNSQLSDIGMELIEIGTESRESQTSLAGTSLNSHPSLPLDSTPEPAV